MKRDIFPFREIRTGVIIRNTAEDVDECYRLTHTHPDKMFTVQTKWGKWFWGECKECHNPIESWSHPNFCGHCGQKIHWEEGR